MRRSLGIVCDHATGRHRDRSDAESEGIPKHISRDSPAFDNVTALKYPF